MEFTKRDINRVNRTDSDSKSGKVSVTIIKEGTPGIDLTAARKEFISKRSDDYADGVVDFRKGLKVLGNIINDFLTENSANDITDSAVMSAKRIKKEIAMLEKVLDTKYLRKDVEDSAKEIITLLKGLKIGQFIPGMVGGSGAQIDKDGNGEMESLTLRNSLVVPKITFNCIDVISGDKANTFAFGTIKTVDTVNQIATLDLLNDQLGTLHVNDICRGVFHSISDPNDKDDIEDSNGFYKYSGFSTSYFSPTEIIVNKVGEMKFRYILQEGTTNHPRVGMNFFAYGNFSDASRQAMTYETRYYTRRLKDVNTWGIVPDKNISMQSGLIEGLNIGGFVMRGYGTFQENNYFTGTTIQFTPEQKNELTPIVISLTNDSGSIECDSNGKVLHTNRDENILVDYQPRTTVSMYQGSTKLMLESIFLATPSGNLRAYSSHNSDKTEYTVSVSSLTPSALDREALEITLKANVNGEAVSRKATFYINKVKNGREGSNGTDGANGVDGKYVQTIYIASDDKPARPSFSSESEIESSDWLKTLPNIKFEASEVSTDNVWRLFNGYYRSNAIGARGFTKESLRFNFDKPTWVKIELVAHCERQYDMGYIGNLDQNYTSKPEVGTYITSMSGNGYKTHAYLLIPSGSHYVQVMYAKDSSGDSFGDYVECRALSANRVWKSSSEAIFDRSYSPARWRFTEWTDPQLYDVSSGEETVYLLAELKSDLAAPYSDPDSDKYLPVITNDLYSSTTLYLEGQKTGYNNRFYENIKQCQGIAPTNTTYWKEVPSWTREPKELGTTYTVQYISKRVKTDNVWGSFSRPAIYTMMGEKGPDGAMPRYCGEYKQGKSYIYGREGDSEYRDIVIYGEGTKMVYQVKNRNSVVTAAPTAGQSDENWEIASKFSFVAMDTALIEGAIVGGLVFRNGQLVSQDGTSIIINGNTGEITGKKMDIEGDVTIGSLKMKVTPVKTDGSYQLLDKSSCIVHDGRYQLPKLSADTFTEIKVYISTSASRNAHPIFFRFPSGPNSLRIIHSGGLREYEVVDELQISHSGGIIRMRLVGIAESDGRQNWSVTYEGALNEQSFYIKY